MAKVTTVTHVCDGCEKEVAKAKDLRRFELSEISSARTYLATVKTDLCTDCERKLQAVLKTLLPAAEFAKIEGIVR